MEATEQELKGAYEYGMKQGKETAEMMIRRGKQDRLSAMLDELVKPLARPMGDPTERAMQSGKYDGFNATIPEQYRRARQ